MVAIAPDGGRTATYDPPTRRWEEHQPLPSVPDAPSRVFAVPSSVGVVGDEVIALGEHAGPDDYWYTWHAFDPATGRWRDIAPSPLEGNSGGQAVWTGDLLFVMGADRTAAAYDPADDCWLGMPPVPLPMLPSNAFTARVAQWWVRSSHWTGDELIAVVVRDEFDFPTGIVSFDPSAWTWTPRSLGPIQRSLARPVLAGGTLWFMDEDPNGRYVTNATYDPATHTWAELDTGCSLGSQEATWTGRLIMEPYADRRAYEPATGTCFRIPASKDRARQWEPVWTGRELIYWSGAYGDTSRAFRDGIVYRPPRRAIPAEDVKPIGRTQRRAIAARREFDFETDPDVVREIMRDPWQPASRRYGFPMSADEHVRILARRSYGFAAQAVADLVRPLSIHAGIWLDERSDGSIVVALTEADPAVIGEIDRLVPGYGTFDWRLVIRPKSMRDMKRALRRAHKVSQRLDPDALLWSVGIDESAGELFLMYDPDDVKRMRSRRKQLEDRLGVPLRITSGRGA